MSLSLNEQILVFSLGDRECAVPLGQIQTVAVCPRVTPVPYMPLHFKGLINIRGRIVSIIDLAVRLGIERKQEPSEPSVILI